jgi:hypothetical protein
MKRKGVIAATVLLVLAAIPSYALQTTPQDDAEVYDPTDAELDAVIDETVAEEAMASGATDDPTEPELVEAEPTSPEQPDSPTLLDQVLAEPEAALWRPKGTALFRFASYSPGSDGLVRQTGATPGPDGSVQQSGDTFTDLASDATRCDAFGADPLDPDRLLTADGRVEGVIDDQLELREIMKECGSPVTRASVGDERVRRHGYIRARALAVMRRTDEAVPQLEILCGADYGIACYQLALIKSVPRNGAPADQGLARQYAERAAGLYVSAAGALLERLEADDWVSRTDLPAFHRAILREDLSAIPHTVSTQRIVLTLFARIQKRGEMWTDPPFTVTDQQNALKLKVPILAERARSAWASLPPLFQGAPRGTGLEAFIEGVLRTGADVFTFGRRVGAIEVAVAAGDAKTMAGDFDARPNSGDRQRYTRSLGRLMALWAQRDPAPDTPRICALFRSALQAHCLPLDDYSADAPAIS